MNMQERALNIFQKATGQTPKLIERLTTGQMHYVYKVSASEGAYIVRMARSAETLKAGLYWLKKLHPLQLPLPKILHSCIESKGGLPPFFVLEYIKGKDLGHVYETLSSEEKKAIAEDIVAIQGKVQTLPKGKGYGWSRGEGHYPYGGWLELIHGELDKSKKKIADTGMADPEFTELVRGRIAEFEDYLSKVEPIAFLDDTTVKNVLIEDGRLQGIIDIECVCFGDPLFTPALTKMGILYDLPYADTEYIDFWCNALRLSGYQRKILDFYAAFFCIGFMGNIGKTFNDDKPYGNERDMERLEVILSKILDSV